MEWLCQMHLLDRCGQITGTREQLGVLGRCSAVQVESTLTDLIQYKTADVTERNGIVTVVNRRMRREYKERNGSKIRMQRMRCDAASDGSITRHSYKSESELEEEREGNPPPADGCAEQVEPAPKCSEIPTLEQAVAMTVNAGIPADFVQFVFQDWSSRNGKDGGGNVVAWLPYVTKRWSREQVEWKAGTHRGKPKGSPNAARREGVPTLAEVTAYAKEKWGDDARHPNWSASFHRHWSDPKRDWKRGGKLVDWKPEMSQQVAKWRTEK